MGRKIVGQRRAGRDLRGGRLLYELPPLLLQVLFPQPRLFLDRPFISRQYHNSVLSCVFCCNIIVFL